MSKYWSAVTRGLTPYVPGEQPKLSKLVKLNTNENPYPPSPRAVAAMQAELAGNGNTDGANLRLYPDPNADRLKSAIAHHFAADGITPAHVFVGNGSDEVLAHAFQGLLKHERPILFPDITYSFYPVYCGLYGVEHNQVALNERFELTVDEYLRPNGGIIFPNPNAPTGRLLPVEAVERIVAGNPDSVVVVDEAYIDFGGEHIPSAVGLVAKYPNLLAFAVSSFYCGVAGALYAYAYIGTVEPEGFNLDLSFKILFMIIIGGAGSIVGAFLGSAFIVLLPIFLDVLVQDVFAGRLPPSIASNLQLMVFGGLIIFFLIVEPHGLARLWQITKEKLRLWPFPH